MRARSSLALIVAVVLAAGSVRWLARPSATVPPPAEPFAAESAEGQVPLLAANDREAAEGYRVEDGVAVPRERVSDATGPGVVVVRVVDERGHPVPGRTVRATLSGWRLLSPGERLDGPGARDALRTRRTDDDGVARWTGLEERLQVLVLAVADEHWSGAWDVGFVGASILTLRVSARTPVSIRVVDGEGRGVPRAAVALYAPSDDGADGALVANPGRRRSQPPAGPAMASAVSDDQGRATLSLRADVRIGRLWVGADGYAASLDRAWTVGDTEVRLERGREVEGTVRDAQGNVVADGVLLWETSQGIRGEAPVAYDGTFTLDDVPSTGVRLEWRLKEAPTLDGRNVRHVTPGGGPIPFVVSLGASVRIRVQGWPRRAGATAYLTPQDDVRPEDSARLVAEVGLDGVATFQGAVPGHSYVLWVPPWREEPREPGDPARDAMVYRKDLLPADEPIVVALEPGRTIRGVIDLAGTDAIGTEPSRGPWRSASVRVEGRGMTLEGSASTGETPCDAREIPFEVAGVPSGASRVSVDLEVVPDGGGPGSRWTGEAPVATGDEPVRVRLRPRPPSRDDR